MLKETIEKVIYEKPVGHNFQEHKKGNEESHIMAQIGG
jgi:cyclic pyranopterin phosphate synthase